MRLTNALKEAGVLEVSPLRNGSGSWTSSVILDAIDHESNGTNFRKFRESHVNEIHAGFNRKAVRNPILVWTGQRLKSIDGRHTIALLKKQGFKKWTAEIHYKMSHEEAASVFYELTMNSKRMGPWDGFSAALEAQYKFAVEISDTINQYRFTTPNHPGYNVKRADLTGFGPLHEAWQKGGKLFLSAFLIVLGNWKHGRLHKLAQLNPFQRGLLDYLGEELRGSRVEDVARRLARREAGAISEIATDYAIQTENPRPDRSHFKQAFHHVGSLAYRRAA